MKGEHIQESEIEEGVKGGILSGVLASLCCVGPLVLVLFGLGSVSFALSLSQYRLYFLGIGFLFMIAVIVFHLKKKNKTCDLNCFSVEGLKRDGRFIISVVLSMGISYILALYVLVPTISPIIYGNVVSKTTGTQSASLTKNAVNTNNDNTNTNSNLHKLVVKISGMTCAGCATGIQSILQSLDGISNARISYPEGIGEITYNPEVITKEEIINSDAFHDYPAVIVEDRLIG